MSALHHLTIDPASLELFRNSDGWLNTYMYHAANVKKRIRAAVNQFRYSLVSPAVLHVGTKSYELTPEHREDENSGVHGMLMYREFLDGESVAEVSDYISDDDDY